MNVEASRIAALEAHSPQINRNMLIQASTLIIAVFLVAQQWPVEGQTLGIWLALVFGVGAVAFFHNALLFRDKAAQLAMVGLGNKTKPWVTVGVCLVVGCTFTSYSIFCLALTLAL